MSAMSDLLRELRLKKKLTQEELAGEIGISHNTYVRYENGLRAPKTEIASRIADYYGISVSELLSGKIQKKESNQTQRSVTDNDIKFALFGEGDVSDEDYEDVKRYAAFIRARKNNGTL